MRSKLNIKPLILSFGIILLINNCTEKPSAPEYYNLFDPQSDFDNNPPVAHISVSADSGIAYETEFIFDVSQSKESEKPDAKLYYQWDFNNDGQWDIPFSQNSTQSYMFTTGGGDRVVKLRVNGAKNLYSDTSIQVHVNSRPVLKVDWIQDSDNALKIIFDASSSWDFEDEDELEFRWDFERDGSWDLSWGSNSKPDFVFSQPNWSVRVEVRDKQFISTYRDIYRDVPVNYITDENFESPMEFGNYQSVLDKNYLKEGRDGWKAYAEATFAGRAVSTAWNWVQRDNSQNSSKCIRGITTIYEMGVLWLFKAVPVSRNHMIKAKIQARTIKEHSGSDTGPSLYLFEGVVDYPAVDLNSLLAKDSFSWGSSSWSPWYTLETIGYSAQDFVTVAIRVGDAWDSYSIYHEYDSMEVEYTD